VIERGAVERRRRLAQLAERRIGVSEIFAAERIEAILGIGTAERMDLSVGHFVLPCAPWRVRIPARDEPQSTATIGPPGRSGARQDVEARRGALP